MVLAEKFVTMFCFDIAIRSYRINCEQIPEKDLLFVSIATS